MTGAAKARWLLVVLAWIGGLLGWLAVPSVHGMTSAWIERGGWRALLAGLYCYWIYWLLFRTAWDMVTDVSDYVGRELNDPPETDLPLINGRLGWGVATTYWWMVLEQCSLVATACAFLILTWKNIDELRGTSLIGFVGLALAFHSIVLRNSAPVYPLPYRWLGLRRHWTEAEVRVLQWPWSARPGLDHL